VTIPKGDENYTVDQWKIPVIDPESDGKYILHLALDRTQEKKLAKELLLERQKTAMAAKLASLGEMAGGIAHEINNPLTIIQGYALKNKSLLKKDELNREESQSNLEKLVKMVNRISKIISGLRRFARDGSNYDKEDVSIQKIVEDSVGLVKNTFDLSEVELHVDHIPDKSIVHVSEVQICQVLVNILINARLEAESSANKNAELKYREEDNFGILSVTDFGKGIDPQIEQKIFEPFFTTREVNKGTGLDLSIRKGIIEGHGGRLHLASRKNPTTFEIAIPLVGKNE